MSPAVWIGQLGIIGKDLEKPILYLLSSGTEIGVLVNHGSDQAHYVRDCAEGIIIHLESRVVENLHPTVNFIEVSMKRRVCPGTVHATSAFYLLLGGTVFCEVVCPLLHHEGENVEIDAAKGKHIRFLCRWIYSQRFCV